MAVIKAAAAARSWGTSWHGVPENDEFRRAFLAEVAALAGRDFDARTRHLTSPRCARRGWTSSVTWSPITSIPGR